MHFGWVVHYDLAVGPFGDQQMKWRDIEAGSLLVSESNVRLVLSVTPTSRKKHAYDSVVLNVVTLWATFNFNRADYYFTASKTEVVPARIRVVPPRSSPSLSGFQL